MDGTNTVPDLLTLDEVAEQLRISIRTVRKLVESGRLPSYRPVPKRVFVSSGDLAAFMRSHRAPPPATVVQS